MKKIVLAVLCCMSVNAFAGWTSLGSDVQQPDGAAAFYFDKTSAVRKDGLTIVDTLVDMQRPVMEELGPGRGKTYQSVEYRLVLDCKAGSFAFKDAYHHTGRMGQGDVIGKAELNLAYLRLQGILPGSPGEIVYNKVCT